MEWPKFTSSLDSIITSIVVFLIFIAFIGWLCFLGHEVQMSQLRFKTADEAVAQISTKAEGTTILKEISMTSDEIVIKLRRK